MTEIEESWPLLAKAQIESWRSLSHSSNIRADANLARALKAEAALREIVTIWNNADGRTERDFYSIGNIARSALQDENAK